MNKEERIERYGEEAYEKLLEQSQAWKEAHPEEVREHSRAWREAHPEEVLANSRERGRKGGKQYDKKLIYDHTGLRSERNIIRMGHRRAYLPYKNIIAPESQLHHQWIPETSKYTGVALVEKDQHMHGFVDVIKILKGYITLFTEEEIRNQGREGSC